MRLAYLDGLRGVAILQVFFYHAYARWNDLMPYEGALSSFLLFKHGNAGVQLFFLISGFVIYLSLENTNTFRSFLWKRWLRLFPAMLVCSLISFTLAGFFHERPAGQPRLIDLLPGLALIEPYYLTAITGLVFKPLEGAFWSIYAETKFYVFAGFIYFVVSRHLLPWFILVAYLFWFLVVKAPYFSEISEIEPVRWRLAFTSLEHFGWFSAGCFFYTHVKQENARYLWLGVAVGCFCAFVAGNFETDKTVTLLIVVGIFVSALRSDLMQRLLKSRWLVFFGFISYPLYLLHENNMVALVIKLSSYLPSWLHIFLPLLSLAALTLTCFGIAKRVEPWLRGRLLMIRQWV